MTDPRAELAVQAANGVPGEGTWYVTLDDRVVVAVVQPSKEIPGETWISRAWDPQMGCFLGGGGQDALDAALAVVEDWLWRRANVGKVRQAVNGDSREKRPHRARLAVYEAICDQQPFRGLIEAKIDAVTERGRDAEEKLAAAPATEDDYDARVLGPSIAIEDDFGSDEDDFG